MVTAYESREEADAALRDGWVVCATLLKSGAPRYFQMPADADESAISSTAFQIREGRPISEFEEALLAAAKRMQEQPA